MRFSHLSIRTKISLAIILVVLVVFVDTFYVVFYKSDQYLIQQVKDDHLELVRTWAAGIKNEIAFSEKIMDLTSAGIDKTRNLTDQIDLVKKRCKRFHAVFAFDFEGRVTAMSDHSKLNFSPSLVYKYLKDVHPEFINANRSFILAPSRPDLKDYIFVFSPYINMTAGEKTNGVIITGVVKKDYLFKKLSDFSASNPKGSEWIVSDSENIIWGRDRTLIGKNLQEARGYFHLSMDRIHELISEKKEGTLSYEWKEKDNIIAYKHMGYPEWSIILLLSNIQGIKALETLEKYLIGIVLINVIFAVVLAQLLSRGITDPLHKLVREADKLKKGDYSISLPTHRKDEIGILANALKKAIEEIQKRQENERNLQFQLLNEHKLAEVGQLVAGIVHNLNNPLNGIQGFAELLKMENPDLSEKCDKILSATENMRNIIENILSKTRQEQSKQEKPIDLNRILITELDFLKADPFFKHRVEKCIELDNSLPVISGIYSDFSQSFSNIIKNALDAMRNTEKKKLTVKTYLKDNYIHVEIADSGMGIPGKNLEHIFEPYFTTKPARDKAGEGEPAGTGLGLYMVHELLKRYNVQYDIRSRLAEGTTFIIKLPYKVISDGE
ncbi:MAG: sensor histidine kinase [Thermodesulfovibrionales bacterium]|jgi:signal transduction histidine kinase|nr:sensor histidine kinase [Thermodesulfovibrionales bacterium]